MGDSKALTLEQVEQSLTRTKDYFFDSLEEINLAKYADLDNLFELDLAKYCDISEMFDLTPLINATDYGPVGSIIPFMGTEAPVNYLICDGTLYSVEGYKYLADHFKAAFGSANYFGGDGTTTFAVPDLRGEFLRGSGTNSHDGQGSGGEVGEHQDGTNHIYFGVNNANTLWFQSKEIMAGDTLAPTNTDQLHNISTNKTVRYSTMSSSASGTGDRDYTSRPTNTSVLFCIKYKPTYLMRVEGGGSDYTLATVQDIKNIFNK